MIIKGIVHGAMMRWGMGARLARKTAALRNGSHSRWVIRRAHLV